MEIREDLYDFVLNRLVEEGNTKKESLFMMSTINENWAKGIETASKMFRIMTGIDKVPIKPPSGPVNLTNIFRGASTQPVKPQTFKIGTSGIPLSGASAVTNANKGGVVTRLMTTAAATFPALLGGSSNTRQQPVQPPVRPRGMSNIPPAEGMVNNPDYGKPGNFSQEVVKTQAEPVSARRRIVPPVRRPSGQKPTPTVQKPTGPITSAQAIQMGSGEGSGPKSDVSTYNPHGDVTKVGRYKTLAQHRAAVAERKSKEAGK